MKDDILQSYVNNFISSNDLTDIDFDKSFEHYVNYNVVSKLYPRDFDFEDLETGGQNDLGIDGAAIIVNGNIIRNPEEIDFLISRNGYIKVVFALIQSKTSATFNGEQIGNFIFGIKSFFDEKTSIPENEKIANLRSIKDKIYKHSINFDELPELKLFFVTTGTWKEPEPIVGKVKRELRELDERNLFRNAADVDFYDAERLKATYRELSRKVVKEIPFNVNISLPDMPNSLNVKQSLVGCIPAKVYLDLITNEDGELSKGLFYDNVRDFQGDNKVNKEIEETLRASIRQSLLPLMNNGVTIISKKVERASTKIKLTDFQIVNGCQTSHVLFENRSLLSADTYLIVKVIETDDQDVTNQIIRATNRQTEVKDEAFESIKPFHRNLQEFYKAKTELIIPAIYYERRSKEYVGNTKVKPWQIVTLAGQIKAYVATKLSQPQSTHRYFGELLESNREKLFSDSTNLLDYYFSSLLVNRIETAYRRGLVRHLHKEYRYHIAFVVFELIRSKVSKKAPFESLVLKTNDSTWLNNLICKSASFISSLIRLNRLSSRDAVRSRDFTLLIQQKIGEIHGV
jgi:hypothetical protein